MRKLRLNNHKRLFRDHLAEAGATSSSSDTSCLAPSPQAIPLVWWIIKRKGSSNLLYLCLSKTWNKAWQFVGSQNIFSLDITEFLMDCPQGVSQVVKGNSLSWFKSFKPKKKIPGSKTEETLRPVISRHSRNSHVWAHGRRHLREGRPEISAVAMDGFPSWSQQASLAWLTSVAWGVDFRRKKPSPVNVSLLPQRQGVARICGLAAEWAVEALSLPLDLQ